jgi:hypothetical protein
MNKRDKHPSGFSVSKNPEEKFRNLFDNAGEGIYQPAPTLFLLTHHLFPGMILQKQTPGTCGIRGS